MTITVFEAKRIWTMDPSLPEATHIAVRDGRVLGLGTLADLQDLGPHRLDRRFAGQVILPGFVEGHSHALEGAMWRYRYAGYFPRHDPDGRAWPGVRSLAQLAGVLREAAADVPADKPVIVWGFDPVYFEGERLDRRLLDEALPDRPVVVLHASLHVLTVNSRSLAVCGLTGCTDVHGVMLGEDGQPNGEMQEMSAMQAVFDGLGFSLFHEVGSEATLQAYGRAAQRVGITTITDLYSPLDEAALSALTAVTGQDDYPVRLVPAMSILGRPVADGVERLNEARSVANERLHFGPVKLMTDGSIQGFTARMLWPGYHNGQPNGLWNAPPEVLRQHVLDYHQAGVQLHIHVNGDEAVELMLDAVEEAQMLWPRPDHRHTLQHAQFIHQAQMRRAVKLGVCLNLFANHLYYWGDVHRQQTLGHTRSRRLEPLASALAHGMALAMHSDAPVTPLGPLFTAWCACNRLSASGADMGRHEAITVAQALSLQTLGAAYTLRLDHRVGSLEVGKFADMVVLDQDPMSLPPEALKDVRVLATVLGGKVHDCPA
ncbi:MAG: amidohydrolase [Lautropia sp.]|nr:amidohydrolase [Lautropia sp.]